MIFFYYKVILYQSPTLLRQKPKMTKLLFAITKDLHQKKDYTEIVGKNDNYNGPLDGNPLREQIMEKIHSKRHWVRMVSFTHYLVVLVNYRYEKVGDEIQLNCDEIIILTKPESNRN